ncbi:hypothetical protein [Streptomyces paradoxus]|uniref:hypothetical protein n=1 Tax=Streptomyces paradoxus TaxID=66375 RepID=UPI00382184B0
MPFLPLEPGEWAIPRVPLCHDRAVIAARVLTARLRTARRTGRPLYGTAAHQPTAPAEQLLLFAQEQLATAASPAVVVVALRTDLKTLDLTVNRSATPAAPAQHRGLAHHVDQAVIRLLQLPGPRLRVLQHAEQLLRGREPLVRRISTRLVQLPQTVDESTGLDLPVICWVPMTSSSP